MRLQRCHKEHWWTSCQTRGFVHDVPASSVATPHNQPNCFIRVNKIADAGWRLILQMLATMTSARKERHEAVHSSSLAVCNSFRFGSSGDPVWLVFTLTGDMALFFVCPFHSSRWFPPTNPFRHQYHASQEDVQRETIETTREVSHECTHCR